MESAASGACPEGAVLVTPGGGGVVKTTDYLKIFFLVAIVLVATTHRGSAFPLLVLLPFFMMNVIYTFVRMLRRPDERKKRGIRLAIWCATFALAGSVQVSWSVASRSDADAAAATVSAHRERTGSYPASLSEVGLSDERLKEKWGLRYSLRDGDPTLVYPARFMWLVMHEYDFETRAWKRNAY